MRDAAKSWGDTVVAVLAVFAAVAFVKGPEDLTKIEGTTAVVAALLVLLAVLCAATAVLLAALAAQGTPASVQGLDGFAYRSLTLARAGAAAKQLALSHALTLVALLLIFVTVGLVWLTALEQRDDESPAAQSVLVVSAHGRAVCGALRYVAGRLRVTSSDGASRGVSRDAVVTPVSGCPHR